ncbi:MAG: molybdopterin-dependent oxidoreductase [Rhodocyclales bacterium]|nr:molybdopterin-dependent oxidoreductase [Rhodocyclales bacterium]
MDIRTTCPYCGTGCGVVATVEAGRIVKVAGDEAHPANFGRLCSKGATLELTTLSTTRALHPELRTDKSQPRRHATWDEALDHAAEKFAAVIREHGPDSVAFYVSGQLLTEDYFVFNKLARALVGTNNIDSNSRLCMSSAVSAYKRTLGADAPPCSYEDIGRADCLLIAGANPAYAHPIVFRQVMEARAANPDLKLIVVDPRATDTAAAADLHLAIEPGTDTVLFGAMLHVLIWDGYLDRRFIDAHTAGFEAARDAVRELTPENAARVCGLGERGAEDIVTAARWFGQAQAALSLWCQGLNQSQHGTDNGSALIHLHLATGQIGKPGAGPFSLTGQPNAMGGRETGTMATLLPGHRDPASETERAEVAGFWNVPTLPDRPGRTAVELFDALGKGEIKAVWIACTNPAQSLPDQAKVRAALERAEFVVLQEAYADTETAAYADLLLPAATWGEKDGTTTNSERRISRTRAAVAPPGDARPDWQIARDFALRLGEKVGRTPCGALHGDTPRLFGWDGPADIFAEHAALTAGRDLDLSGLSYAVLERDGPQQWPYPKAAPAGTARLYEDRRFATADSRARFVDVRHATVAEATDARHPLHLNTGRLRDQWHGMSRTGLVARLYNHAETPVAACHPDDLQRRGIAAGELLRIKNRRGEIVLPAVVDPAQKPGHVFLPMHWGRRRLNSAGANELTIAALDPHSKQPEFKHAAVRIEPANLPWRGLLLRRTTDPEQALRWSRDLAPLLGEFGYAALTLAGRETTVLTLQLASTSAPGAELRARLLALLGLDTAQALNFADARRGIEKRALVEDGVLAGLALFGETAAGGWLKEAMLADQPIAPLRPWLFLPAATPPANLAHHRGRIVCNCKNISETDIADAVAAGCDDVQAQTGCGTGCGACLPELKKMLLSLRCAA